MVDAKKILIVGATGYIGRKLLQKLDMRGNLVRCFARSSHQLSGHISSRVELMCGDVLDPDCLLEATTGIHTAYYFIHCMGSRSRISFEIQDRKAAENFVDACQKNGVSRIIYLGGLGRGKKLSAHLRSRQEVGEILRRSGIDVIEFRASIVIGAGSLSFEMVRALVELFPILLAPKGVEVLSQPIAVEDVLEYLLKALKCESRGPQIFEIGGKEQVSYANIMKEYAKQRGLKRHIIPLSFVSPNFTKFCLRFFLSDYSTIGKHLVESLRNETIVSVPSAERYFSICPKGLKQSISAALQQEKKYFTISIILMISFPFPNTFTKQAYK